MLTGSGIILAALGAAPPTVNLERSKTWREPSSNCFLTAFNLACVPSAQFLEALSTSTEPALKPPAQSFSTLGVQPGAPAYGGCEGS